MNELAESARAWENAREEALSKETRRIKTCVGSLMRCCVSYPDIEGGYLLNEDVIGHSFPDLYRTRKYPSPTAARTSGGAGGSGRKPANRPQCEPHWQDGKDLVLVAVLANETASYQPGVCAESSISATRASLTNGYFWSP